MTRSRKILLVIIALVVLADFLPATREEFAWWWASSHNHTEDYENYLGEWPEGRHVAQAKSLADERRWGEIKRAQISKAANARPLDAKALAADRLQRAAKLDDFFWKQALTENTVASYNDYLREFPQGKHAAAARQKLATPGLPASAPEQPASP